METAIGSFHPERVTEHYKYLLAYLPIGKSKKINKEDLFKKYKEGLFAFDEEYKNGNKKILAESSFQRITRKLCEEARKDGWKVIYSMDRNDSGIWICKDEVEFEVFKDMQIRKVKKSLQEIANMEKKALKKLIAEIFSNAKKQNEKLSENSLFTEEETRTC
jgi:hypothetical protein